jgi:hypothetical protein
MVGLTDTEIKRAKAAEKAYSMGDGGGLYLWIKPTGGKLWRIADEIRHSLRSAKASRSAGCAGCGCWPQRIPGTVCRRSRQRP